MKASQLPEEKLQALELQAISSWLELLLKGAIDIARIWIGRIPDQYARETLTDLANTFKEVVGAVADEDPNDSEQIKKIIDKFLTDTGFVDRTKTELLKKIDALGDERLKVVLRALLPVSFDIIKQLFDSNPANEEQIKARLRELLKSPDAQNVLTSLLTFIIKDENTARLIAGLILSIVTQVGNIK